jgi:hypothetical protein
MRKWVRYEAPIMVCVELDDTAPDGGRVVNVVLGTDRDDITLARDFRGHFLVYDQLMERAQHDERTDQRAITIAEHREWPDRPDWEEGPDALRYPGLYDTDEPDDDEDDPEPLDLDEDSAAVEITGLHPNS